MFDYLVIGAGSGGIASARRAASYGAKVAVFEYGERLILLHSNAHSYATSIPPSTPIHTLTLLCYLYFSYTPIHTLSLLCYFYSTLIPIHTLSLLCYFYSSYTSILLPLFLFNSNSCSISLLLLLTTLYF